MDDRHFSFKSQNWKKEKEKDPDALYVTGNRRFAGWVKEFTGSGRSKSYMERGGEAGGKPAKSWVTGTGEQLLVPSL
jgi:hypothetical protein